MIELQAQWEELQQYLKENYLQTTDNVTVNMEEAVHDHVSNVLPDAVDHNAFHIASAMNNDKVDTEYCELFKNIGMGYSFVQIDDQNVATHDTNNTSTREPGKGSIEKSLLLSFQKIIQPFSNVNANDVGEHYSTRTKDPINEFQENNELFAGAFPYIFMLGLPPYQGSLDLYEVRHLLLQYNCHAAHCRDLIFLLLSQHLRHQNIKNVNKGITYLDNNKLNELISFIHSPTYEEDIAEAIENPTSFHAKKIIKQCAKIMKVPKTYAHLGYVERNLAVKNIYTMQRKYGPAFAFFTMSIDFVNNPNVCRLEVRSSDNLNFPAVATKEFFNAMKEYSVYKGSVEFDCSFARRSQSLSNNPVAISYEYNCFIDCLCETIIGLENNIRQSTGTDQKQTRTETKKGLFGHPLAFYGTNDKTDAGIMHAHMIIFASLSPALLHHAIFDQTLRNEIQTVLESYFRVEIDTKYHVLKIMRHWIQSNRLQPLMLTHGEESLKQLLSPSLPPAAICIPPDILSDNDVYNHTMQQRGSKVQPHNHTFTCHKTHSGQKGCRMCYPRRECKFTGPCLLIRTSADDIKNINNTNKDNSLSMSIDKKGERKDEHYINEELYTNNSKGKNELNEDKYDNNTNNIKRDGSTISMNTVEEQDVELNVQDKNSTEYNEIDNVAFKKAWNVYPIDSLEAQSKINEILQHKFSDKQRIQEYNNMTNYEKFDCLIKTYSDGDDEDCITVWDIKRRNVVLPFSMIDNDNKGSKITDIISVNQMRRNLISIINEQLTTEWWEEEKRIILTFIKYLQPQFVQPLYEYMKNELPIQNLLMVCFNPTCTTIYGSNSANYILGSTNESINSSYYLVPYVGKNNFQVMQALSSLQAAKRKFDQIGSQAMDRDTDERELKFIITNVLNKMDLTMEISDMQACSVLLGGTTELCSDTFDWINIEDFIKYVNKSKEFDNNYNDIMLAYEGNVNESIICRRMNYAKEHLAGVLIYKKCSDESNEEEVISVPTAVNYCFRGEGLKMLSRMEYIAVIRIVEKSKKKNTNISETSSRRRGRTKNKRYAFDEHHPLFTTHEQVVRSKIVNPRLFHKVPTRPTVPATDNELWHKQANEYAQFMLVMFRPEDRIYAGQFNNYSYDWKTFISWIDDLRNDNKKISAMRLVRFQHFNSIYRPNKVINEALKFYAQGNRTVWQDDNLFVTNEINTNSNATASNDDEENDMEDILSMQQLLNMLRNNSNVISHLFLNNQKIVNRSKSLLQSFEAKIFESQQGKNEDNNSTATSLEVQTSLLAEVPYLSRHNINVSHIHDKNSVWSDDMDNDDANDMNVFEALYEHIRKCKKKKMSIAAQEDDNSMISSEITSSEPTASEYKIMLQQTMDYVLNQFSLSKDKLNVMKKIQAYIIDVLMSKRYKIQIMEPVPFMFINGPPGVGKSFFIDVLTIMIQSVDKTSIGTFRMSYTGIAASNIDGHTIFILHLPINLKRGTFPAALDDMTKFNIRNNYDLDFQKHIFIIVIDELSTIEPTYFYAVLNRLKELLNVSSIQDIPLIMFGDLHQHLPIIQKHSFAMAIERLFKNHHYNIPTIDAEEIACNHFLNVEWVELTEQQRSSDIRHNDILLKLFHNECITMKDLRYYKLLEAKDIEMKSFWQWATIICHTNQERKTFEVMQAIRFATMNNKLVIRWKCNHKLSENVFKGKYEQATSNNIIDDNDPLQYQYFVQHAPITILENINTELGIVNGLNATLHSLSFKNHNDEGEFQSLCENKPTGSIITLREPPASINVELFAVQEYQSDQKKQKNFKLQHQWTYGSLIPNKVIICLINKHKKTFRHQDCMYN